jgi:hypothetical protein
VLLLCSGFAIGDVLLELVDEGSMRVPEFCSGKCSSVLPSRSGFAVCDALLEFADEVCVLCADA